MSTADVFTSGTDQSENGHFVLDGIAWSPDERHLYFVSPYSSVVEPNNCGLLHLMGSSPQRHP